MVSKSADPTCPECGVRKLTTGKDGNYFKVCFPCNRARQAEWPLCETCGVVRVDPEKKYTTCYSCNQEGMEPCECGRGNFNPAKSKTCYECYLDSTVPCEFCGEKRYNPDYDDRCFECSRYGVPSGKATPPPDSRPAAPVVDELDDLPF